MLADPIEFLGFPALLDAHTKCELILERLLHDSDAHESEFLELLKSHSTCGLSQFLSSADVEALKAQEHEEAVMIREVAELNGFDDSAPTEGIELLMEKSAAYKRGFEVLLRRVLNSRMKLEGMTESERVGELRSRYKLRARLLMEHYEIPHDPDHPEQSLYLLVIAMGSERYEGFRYKHDSVKNSKFGSGLSGLRWRSAVQLTQSELELPNIDAAIDRLVEDASFENPNLKYSECIRAEIKGERRLHVHDSGRADRKRAAFQSLRNAYYTSAPDKASGKTIDTVSLRMLGYGLKWDANDPISTEAALRKLLMLQPDAFDPTELESWFKNGNVIF